MSNRIENVMHINSLPCLFTVCQTNKKKSVSLSENTFLLKQMCRSILYPFRLNKLWQWQCRGRGTARVYFQGVWLSDCSDQYIRHISTFLFAGTTLLWVLVLAALSNIALGLGIICLVTAPMPLILQIFVQETFKNKPSQCKLWTENKPYKKDF